MPAVPRDFPPTVEAARARLAAVRPADYARSRNHLNGAVTRLSPYLTHGLLALAEVVDTLRTAHRLPLTHKLMHELGWRAFFRHAWRHDGERILESLHPGPLPDAAYGTAVPEDVRAGATGVPVIDQAVRTLYATGYLHNHTRMWLASYLVHIRKVHWRTGADWMVAHLLDGDLGSNHLSWQWVAGTASAKPYLFNADNVANTRRPTGTASVPPSTSPTPCSTPWPAAARRCRLSPARTRECRSRLVSRTRSKAATVRPTRLRSRGRTSGWSTRGRWPTHRRVACPWPCSTPTGMRAGRGRNGAGPSSRPVCTASLRCAGSRRRPSWPRPCGLPAACAAGMTRT